MFLGGSLGYSIWENTFCQICPKMKWVPLGYFPINGYVQAETLVGDIAWGFTQGTERWSLCLSLRSKHPKLL